MALSPDAVAALKICISHAVRSESCFDKYEADAERLAIEEGLQVLGPSIEAADSFPPELETELAEALGAEAAKFVREVVEVAWYG